MNMLKIAVTESPAIWPINYLSPNEVILSVDSSYLACSWILLQLDDNSKHCPESRYSQAKFELYGLFHTLKAAKVWLIGVKKFTVEVDTKYIKGMLNNPDIQLNAAMNRWIVGILMFDFTLKHVPGSKHQGLDRLSCRQHAPEDNDEDDESSDDIEEWIEEILGCGLWVANNFGSGYLEVMTHATVLQFAETLHLSDLDIPSNDASHSHDEELQILRTYLETLALPAGASMTQRSRILKQAHQFFTCSNCLWHKNSGGRHQIVVFRPDRSHILHETHDCLGHKGFYPTRHTIADHFWWLTLDKDVAWYLRTCHQCQLRIVEKVIIPPTVAVPAPLFCKACTDSMHMPVSHGYSYIVQA
jgi:hypothetical protein